MINIFQGLWLNLKDFLGFREVYDNDFIEALDLYVMPLVLAVLFVFVLVKGIKKIFGLRGGLK